MCILGVMTFFLTYISEPKQLLTLTISFPDHICSCAFVWGGGYDHCPTFLPLFLIQNGFVYFKIADIWQAVVGS